MHKLSKQMEEAVRRLIKDRAKDLLEAARKKVSATIVFGMGRVDEFCSKLAALYIGDGGMGGKGPVRVITYPEGSHPAKAWYSPAKRVIGIEQPNVETDPVVARKETQFKVFHETGHVRHTDPKVLEEEPDLMKDKFLMLYLNIFEDPREEWEMLSEYPGDEDLVRETRQGIAIDNLREMDETLDPNPFTAALVVVSETFLHGKLSDREKCVDSVRTLFPKPGVAEEYIDDLVDVSEKVLKAKGKTGTRKTFDLSRYLREKYLTPLEQQNQGNGEGEGEEGEGEEGEGNEGNSTSSGKGKQPKSRSGKGNPSSGASDDSSEGEDSADGEEGNEEGDGEKDGKEGSSSGSGDEDKDGEGKSGKGKKQDPKSGKEKSESSADGKDGKDGKDGEEGKDGKNPSASDKDGKDGKSASRKPSLKNRKERYEAAKRDMERVREAMKGARVEEYIGGSTAPDIPDEILDPSTMEDPSKQFNRPDEGLGGSEWASMLNRTTRTLENSMATRMQKFGAMAQSMSVQYDKTGRLDMRRVVSVEASGTCSLDVFKSEEVGQDTSFYLLLVIDGSGSMNGRPTDEACKIAYTLAKKQAYDPAFKIRILICYQGCRNPLLVKDYEVPLTNSGIHALRTFESNGAGEGLRTSAPYFVHPRKPDMALFLTDGQVTSEDVAWLKEIRRHTPIRAAYVGGSTTTVEAGLAETFGKNAYVLKKTAEELGLHLERLLSSYVGR